MRRAYRWLAALLAVIASAGCRHPAEADGAAGGDELDLIRARPIETVTETRRLDLSNRRSRSLLDGWWRRPQWNTDLDLGFVWAIEREASLRFYVLDVQDFQFLVKMTSPAELAGQRVAAIVNGEPVSEFEPEPMFLEYRFVVPARLLHRGANTLTFRHSSLTRGGQTLAAAYASILTGPNCVPLRPRGEPPSTGVKTGTREGGSKEIHIIGPAELSYRLTVPPPGRLRVRLALPPDARASVIFTATVEEGGASTEVGRERIAPSLFGFPVSRDVVMDVGAFGGRDVVLRIGAYPETCKDLIGDLTIDHLALLTAPRSAID